MHLSGSPNPLDGKLIGQRLQDSRRAAGLAQVAVANYFGINKTQVSKWETGKELPKLDRLVHLAWLYGESLHYIVTGDQRPRKATAKELAAVRGAVGLESTSTDLPISTMEPEPEPDQSRSVGAKASARLHDDPKH